MEVVKLRIGLTQSVEGSDLNIFKDSTFRLINHNQSGAHTSLLDILY